MMKIVSLYISVIASAVLVPSVCVATEKFYVIAHMVNDDRSAGWALNSGANAVEIDMNFDNNTGQPTRFHHGTPCDCTCLMEIFTGGSVCHLSNVCKGSSNVADQFTYLRKFQALALIYIDSKTDTLSVDTRKKAGKAVVKKLETELFAKGYKGKVLIGSGNNKEYLVAAADQAKLSSYASKVYFTLDQDRSVAINTLDFLTSLSVHNIVYSTGISICSPKTYYNEIKMAGINKDRGVVSNVFVWTLDKESSFDNYYTAGARGILTNKVPNLVAWARAKGLQLATPGDDSLSPATSKSIVRTLGSCDCDYHIGGCSISRVAPKGTACECLYKGGWTCGGKVTRCLDGNSPHCINPDNTHASCIQGAGDCGGYGAKNCDCDYHHGGCSISKVAPKGTACKCVYKGGLTCGGDITRCSFLLFFLSFLSFIY